MNTGSFNGNFSSLEELEKNKESKIQEDPKIKKQKYLEIKKIYKTEEGRSFERLMNVVKGKKPKWRKIARYNQKELDFLLDTYQGKTRLTQSATNYIDGLDGLSIEEQKQRKHDSNWLNFTTLLQNREALKKHTLGEERRGR